MHAISHGTAQISDDPLAMAILSLVAVCKADFGEQWAKQFSNEEELRMWKRRAYRQMKGFEPATVVDGYERAVKVKAPYMPSLNDIVMAVRGLGAERERERAALAYVNAPKLTPGSGIAGYVEFLDAQADGDLARGCIAMMREIFAKQPAKTEEEREQRMAKALSAHDTLIKMKPLIPRAYGERRECGKTGCDSPGTISHNTTGEGPWFCAAHAR